MLEEERGTVVRGICKEVFTLLHQKSKLRKEVGIHMCGWW